MSHVLGATSLARLVGVYPPLAAVVERAIAITRQDFMVLEGVRSDEQCYINFGKGRTASECVDGGCPRKYAQPRLDKVTWVGHALSSPHRKRADGYGHAVDLVPYPVDWDTPAKFDAIAEAMFTAARELGIKPGPQGLRWGADWDQDGKPRERGESDSPHWEIG